MEDERVLSGNIMDSPPEAPESLPKYISDGVPKQGDEALQDLQSWIDEILEYRHDIDEDDFEEEGDEEIEEVDSSGTKTKVVKKVKCGKSNCKCARGKEYWHGPYSYACWREDGEMKWEYIGPVES